MKVLWHFDRSGRFLREVQGECVGRCPLADDGFPRTVDPGPVPEHDARTQRIMRGRTGWHVVPLSLEEVRAVVAAEIDASVASALAAGVEVGGHLLGAGPDDQGAWTSGVVALANAEQVAGRSLADLPVDSLIGPVLDRFGRPVAPQPTVSQFRAMAAGLAQAIGGIRARALAARQALAAADSVTAAAAVHWGAL